MSRSSDGPKRFSRLPQMQVQRARQRVREQYGHRRHVQKGLSMRAQHGGTGLQRVFAVFQRRAVEPSDRVKRARMQR